MIDWQNLRARETRRLSSSQQQQQEQTSGKSLLGLDEETMYRLTVDTLEELDWCLDQLEAIQAHRSVGDLATSKFRRMLNKELSHVSESKSGSQISGFIRSFLGKFCRTTMAQQLSTL